MPTWSMWTILVLLLIVRGLFAAMEAALQALSDDKAKELATAGSHRARRLLKLKTDPEATAAAIRLGMVLSGFIAVGTGTFVIPRVLDVSLLEVVESSWMVWLTPLTSALVVALVATLIDITFRSAALQKPEGWALNLSRLGMIAVTLLWPMVKLLVAPLNLALKAFGTKVSFQPPPPPLEELEKQLIRQAQKNEVDRGAPQLIRSIFELNEKSCRDVMVPRTEVVGLAYDAPMEEILQLIAEENHSRIPVFKDDVDHIVGILHVRDLVPMLQNPELIVMSDLLRPAVYVPWVKPIGDLLRDMQRQRIHMAVVVDEYGGFSGIVTLEDILREIVGDIRDEFDEEVRAFEKQADDSFLVDAMLPVEDFARAFDFKFPEGDFETLAGFLSHKAGAIPEVGDRTQEAGWTFIVHSKEGPKLERVRVVKPKVVPAGTRRPSYERLEAVKA
ncbi:MAG: hemolysin family protein [Archangium sp.]|nr:hemolysin family protein [Archangium sp.]